MTLRQCVPLCLCLIPPLGCFGQQPTPAVHPLIVDCTCGDTVGKAYARSLHDEIAKSSRYEQVANVDSNRKKAITLSIVSVPIEDDAEGNAGHGAFSIVLLLDGSYVTQYVQTCPIEWTSQCATSTLQSVDEILRRLP